MEQIEISEDQRDIVCEALVFWLHRKMHNRSMEYLARQFLDRLENLTFDKKL